MKKFFQILGAALSTSNEIHPKFLMETQKACSEVLLQRNLDLSLVRKTLAQQFARYQEYQAAGFMYFIPFARF